MTAQVITAILFHLAFLGLIFFCQFLYKRMAWPAEYCRKLAHVVAGLTSLSFCYFFDSHWYVLSIGVSFTLLLGIGKRFNWFPGIDSISRSSAGSSLLPLSTYLTFLVAENLDAVELFIVPILILSVSDPLAAMVGAYWSRHPIKVQVLSRTLDKTRQGSFAFFLSAILLSAISLAVMGVPVSHALVFALPIGLSATLAELFASQGWDNMSIPVFVIATLYWLPV